MIPLAWPHMTSSRTRVSLDKFAIARSWLAQGKPAKFALCLPLILLVACGGGGGDDGESFPQRPKPEEVVKLHDGRNLNFSDYNKEFELELSEWKGKENDYWALNLVNAAEGYTHSYLITGSEKPGDGITIGFIDDNFNENHLAFEDRLRVIDGFDWGIEYDTHGTEVASVAIGADYGLAYGANGIGINTEPFDSFEVLANFGSQIGDIIDNNNIDILNLS